MLCFTLAHDAIPPSHVYLASRASTASLSPEFPSRKTMSRFFAAGSESSSSESDDEIDNRATKTTAA